MTSHLRARRRLLLAVTTLALLAVLAHLGLLDAGRIAFGMRNVAIFARDLFPPDPEVIGRVGIAILETIEIAFAGTLLGSIAALPLAIASSEVAAGAASARVMRAVLAFIRTIPALLWAVVFVVAVGLGAAAGTLGLAGYSAGYLGKLYADAMDGVDPEVIEAVRATGASRVQIARLAIIPETLHALLTQLLFVFEYNVRASSILGFVGAGGIGFYLLGYLQSLQYDRLMTAVLATFVAVMLIDALSARLYRWLTEA